MKENTDSGAVDGESYNSNLIQGKECPHLLYVSAITSGKFWGQFRSENLVPSETYRLRAFAYHHIIFTFLFLFSVHSIKIFST